MRRHTIYIGLESNVGNRVAALREAVRRLSARVDIRQVSQLYAATLPGGDHYDRTLNAVVHATTDLTASALLGLLQGIERTMGRLPGDQFGPRPIDLDLLFFDHLQLDTIKLTVPHPKIPMRAAVLKPLAEIAPKLMHPTLFYTVSELLQDVDDPHLVQRYAPEQPYERAVGQKPEWSNSGL